MKSYVEWLEEGVLKVPTELTDFVVKCVLEKLSEKLSEQFNGKKEKFLNNESSKLVKPNNISMIKIEEIDSMFFVWNPLLSSLPILYKKFFDERVMFGIVIDDRINPRMNGAFVHGDNNIITYFIRNDDARDFYNKLKPTEQDKMIFMFNLRKTIQHELGHLIDYKLKLGKNDLQLNNDGDYETKEVEFEERILDMVEDFLLDKTTNTNNVNDRIKLFVNNVNFFLRWREKDIVKYKLAVNKFQTEVKRRLEELV